MKMKKVYYRWIVSLLITAGLLSTNATALAAKQPAAVACSCKHCSIKVKVKPSKRLYEGVTLTKKMANSVLQVTRNGKKIKNFTVTQIGKTVSKGRYRLTACKGIHKGTVLVKVNSLTGIHITKCRISSLEKGSFSTKSIRKCLTVKGSYKKGSDKKLNAYVLSIEQNGNNVVVTAKYRKFTDSVSIPLTDLAPTLEPTLAPTLEPTLAPTLEPTLAPTLEPTLAPTLEPTLAPTLEPTLAPTLEPTLAPTLEPTLAPTLEPTLAPTLEPTANPFSNVTVIRSGDEGNVSVNDHLCTFSDGIATQKVIKGLCTLVAFNTSNYTFSHWVNPDTKEVLSSNPIFPINVFSDTKVMPVFEKSFTVTVKRVGGRGMVIYNGEPLDFTNNIATFKVAAGRYTLTAASTDDYSFSSWGAPASSTDTVYTVSVSNKNLEITVNFMEIEKAVNVTYRHDNNGQILLTETVAFGESLTPPTENLWQSNRTFSGWQIGDTIYYGFSTDKEFYDADGNSLSDAIKALTGQKQDVNIVSYFIDNPTRYYNVSIQGGEIISFDGEKTDAGLFKDDTHIFIKPLTPEGKYFAGWVDSEGNTVTYEEEYDFFVHSNISLVATFSDIPTEKVPTVHFTGNQYEISFENKGVTLFMALELPEGFEKVEWRIMYAEEPLSENEMVLGNDKVESDEIVPTVSGSTDWRYYATIYNESIWENRGTVYFRLVLYYSDNTGLHETYSPILSVPCVPQKFS